MLTVQTRSLLVLSQAPKMVSMHYERNMQAIPRCELLNEMLVGGRSSGDIVPHTGTARTNFCLLSHTSA
jgi:hypothetical protein